MIGIIMVSKVSHLLISVPLLGRWYRSILSPIYLSFTLV